MKKFAVIGCVFVLLFTVAPVMAEESANKTGGHMEGAPEGVEIETTLDGWVNFCVPTRFQFTNNKAFLICPNGAWIAGWGNPHASVYAAAAEALYKWRIWKWYQNGVYKGFEAHP